MKHASRPKSPTALAGQPSGVRRPSTGSSSCTATHRAQLRQWLEYVAETAIEMLDALDDADLEREDDELGDDETEEALRA